MKSLLEIFKGKVQSALAAGFGAELADTDPLVTAITNPKFGDYQSNVALSLPKKLKKAPRVIAETIVDNLDVGDICDDVTIAGPGFINFTLKPSYLSSLLKEIEQDSRLGIEKVQSASKVVVDFSSPNIAKEMHVGHLRSTIIGDSIARILEFRGYDVLRLNHVGDWGTQFGMLIAYLREAYPEALTTADALDIGDLVSLYKKAKIRFDQDPEFKETARNEVVNLQAGAEDSRHAWQLLCDQSRREFQVIYDLLDIKLTERGESFYNPFLPEIITILEAQELLEEDAGAKCVFLEGFTNKDGDPLPLIVQKSDGGFNYATTDLAALNYRIKEDKANRIIYVTDAGQANHFAGVFQVAKRAKIVPETVDVVHVPFGLVLGEDGKRLKTRSGETVKLRELLDEAVLEATRELKDRLEQDNREESSEFINQVGQVIGISAVKYADLSQNRTTDYKFSYKKMLALKGNTAPYLLYAYVRTQGISRKGNIDFNNLDTASIVLEAAEELVLVKHLLKLSDVIQEVERDLLPNRLCQYLFELSQKFNQFFENCPVLQADEPQKTSRLILAHTTAKTLKLGLHLLGIEVLERM
ncbi:MAG: arginine--tRNA ligase [Xenococcaceae cyanobacterium MO_167.B52]|nr:arginine--tRNA ligase [Xenococcaceae cyanobacterium MO_167.B52]